ncbi:MAG: ABC transporter permease, partial [Paracoccus sp. (in: a-proteobacteria)]|nr:ABC transporter permease [Paracoccus sp. (in: a-proteobacteria)]
MSTLRNVRQNLPVIAPIVALVVLILIGMALTPNFLSYANITNVLARSAFI